MIRREDITISGTVLYCDGVDCPEKGPAVPYDNADEVIDSATEEGWLLEGEDAEENTGDLCPKCVKSKNLIDTKRRIR